MAFMHSVGDTNLANASLGWHWLGWLHSVRQLFNKDESRIGAAWRLGLWKSTRLGRRRRGMTWLPRQPPDHEGSRAAEELGLVEEILISKNNVNPWPPGNQPSKSELDVADVGGIRTASGEDCYGIIRETPAREGQRTATPNRTACSKRAIARQQVYY